MRPHGQSRLRPPAWSARVLSLLLMALPARATAQAPAAAEAEPRGVITSAREVKRLTPEQARSGQPVRLRGVVVYYDQQGFVDLIVHDGTAGIYLADTKDKRLRVRPGDLVEVDGVSGPGDYAPVVRMTALRVVGTAPLPPAQEVSHERLASGVESGEWVRIRGIVRAATPSRLAIPGALQLDVMTSGGRMNARVQNYDRARVAELVDSEVVLTGACTAVFNRRRQLLDVRLSVPTQEHIEIVRAAPADPFALPGRPINRLRQYDPESTFGHRVKVRGVVTLHDKGRALFIRDETQGLRIDTQQKSPLQVGDEVEVLGFVGRGGYSPKLEDATYRRTGATRAVAPIAAGIAEARAGQHDGDLVQLEGVLLDWIPNPAEHVLLLQREGRVFRAHLPRGDAAITPVAPRSGVRATGICVIETGPGLPRPQSFHLLLRSAADVVVLQSPPWWNARRLAWALGVFALVALGASVWVVLLRRRVATQTALIGEKIHQEAILQERHRMAREIHDTLVQSFAAISLQLEAIRDKLTPGDPGRVARHLEIAHRLARESMVDARRSIWALHSMAGAGPNLATSLAASCKSITDGTGIENAIAVEGELPPLPAEIENNLLYIGREAVINSVKHAAPKRIELTLRREPRALLVIVRDDGRGFEHPGDAGATRHRGFGMISMQERAQQISAALTFDSRAGEGTTVCVTVPLREDT